MTHSLCRCPAPAERRERRFPTARPTSRLRPRGTIMLEASTCERSTPIHRRGANSPTWPRRPNGCRSHTASRSVRRNSIPRRDRISNVLPAICKKIRRRPRCCWPVLPMISAARAPISNWPGSGLTPCVASWSRSAPNATPETYRWMVSGKSFRLPATTLSLVGKRTAASRCFSCDEPRSCACLFCTAPAPIFGTGAATRSFKFDRLVFSGFVERRSPDLVRSLVLAAAETERYAKTKIEIAGVLQNIDEPLGVDLRAAAPQRVDQHVCRNETLQRDVVRTLAGKIFRKRVLVLDHRARIAAHRGHRLGHDDILGKTRPQQHQLLGEAAGAHG